MSYFVFYCQLFLHESCSGSITSVGEERANLLCLLVIMWCLFGEFSSSSRLGAWGGLRYFIVALPGHSI